MRKLILLFVFLLAAVSASAQTVYPKAVVFTQAGQIIQAIPASVDENGKFLFIFGQADVDTPGERHDATVQIGWNLDNGCVPSDMGQSGCGQTGLIFESFCGPSVGCPGAGQSETYFLVSDPYGRSSRPFGIFQSYDNSTPGVFGIFRMDATSFWDASDTYEALAITFDVDHVGVVTLTDNARIAFTADVMMADFNAISINGTNALAYTTDAVLTLCPDSGCTIGGGDGSGVVLFGTNHTRFTNPLLEAADGTHGIVFSGSDAHYWSLNSGGGGAGSGLLAKPLGSDSNIDVEIQTKGNGNLMLTTIGANGGVIWNMQSNAFMQIYDLSGTLRTGVNATGTSCTITRITHGLITGGSCS